MVVLSVHTHKILVSSVKIEMNAGTTSTTAIPMQSASMKWVHIPVCAVMDTLEMVSATVQTSMNVNPTMVIAVISAWTPWEVSPAIALEDLT
jgi:hypothetical protein